MIQMSFDEVDFGGGKRAEKSFENLLMLNRLWVEEFERMLKLRKGGFTDVTAGRWLDYLNSPAGELGYRAYQEEIRGHAQQDLDFEAFARGFRWVLRNIYAAGKVKGINQKRRKRSKKSQKHEGEGEGK